MTLITNVLPKVAQIDTRGGSDALLSVWEQIGGSQERRAFGLTMGPESLDTMIQVLTVAKNALALGMIITSSMLMRVTSEVGKGCIGVMKDGYFVFLYSNYVYIQVGEKVHASQRYSGEHRGHLTFEPWTPMI